MKRAKQPLSPMAGAALALASVGLSLSSFMQIVDQTIANVSIPTIAGNLGVSPNQGTWIITSFGVATAISLPLTGWLAQRIGQVRLLLWSTSLFALASVLCGSATSLEMLVAARVLQGAVAGPMMPLSQAMLLAIYPPERRVTALTLWSSVTIVAPVFGPLLGGWISDNWGWPWIFFINVPVGVLAALLTLHVFRGKETQIKKAPIDVVGLVLLALWVGSLQVMLDTGNDAGWFEDDMIVLYAIVAVVGFCYFVIWELTAAHPAVDLRLFQRRNYTIGVFSSSLGYTVFFGSSVIVPLWLQTQLGYSAAWAGVAVAPVSVFPLLLGRSIGRGMQRIDPRVFASCAFLAFAWASFIRAGFTTQVTLMDVVSAQLVTGLGVAMFMVPLQSISLAGLRADQVASASGMSNFARVIGGSFGASIATTLWTRREAVHHAHLAETLSTWDPNTSSLMSELAARGVSSEQAYGVIERMLSSQSHLLGAVDYFWLSGWVLLALVLAVWLARPPFSPGGAVRAAD